MPNHIKLTKNEYDCTCIVGLETIVNPFKVVNISRNTDIPGWLQTALYTLMGLFNWVGLQKNFNKTVVMVCQPWRVAGVRVDKPNTRRMMG